MEIPLKTCNHEAAPNQFQFAIAMKEIQAILFKSEDIEVQLLVTTMTRNKLLLSSGALNQQLQMNVNEACKLGNSIV